MQAQSTQSVMRNALAVALITFLTSGLCLLLLYRIGKEALAQEVRCNLIQLAKTAATVVDGDLHKTFYSPEQEQSPAYLQAIAPLQRILKVNPEIRFLYTMTDHNGIPCFVLDATPSGDLDHDGVEDHSPIMQPFETPAPALRAALATHQAGADAEPITDSWGTYLSAYAPFHDSRGDFAGVVGVDLKLDHYTARLAGMRRALGIGFATALGLALLIGLGIGGIGLRTFEMGRKKRETDQALRQSEGNYQALAREYQMMFEQMVNGFAVHEMIYDGQGTPVDYRFLDVNPAFEQMTGLKRDAILGQTVKTVLPTIEAHWIETYGEVVRSGTPFHFENYSQSLDRYFQVTAYRPAPGKFACIIADITQQKRLEAERQKEQEQLQHVQKLEGLGLLAGGIAHDFNNLLMAILGNADLALHDLPSDSSLAPSLNQIKRISLQAADLCKQMLAYSGRGKFIVEALDISRLVADMTKLIEVSVSKKVVLRYNLASSLPALEADASQLRQVVMNLVINASEAIGEKSGVVSLTTGVLNCDAAFLHDVTFSSGGPPGPYVFLEVTDTGSGIDPDTQARIFDPFFTTKFTGRGLGLAAVMGIVRGHTGAIQVQSSPDQGSTFKVFFPASGRSAVSEVPVPQATTWRGVGTILLVDDEETIRSVTRRMLERAGFTVVTCDNGKEAIQLFKDLGDHLSCVLMDLTMPQMDGDVASHEMFRIRTDIPIILSSGYNSQDIKNRFAGTGLMSFIQKPYSMATLLETLHSVLESRNAHR
jgi:PAS domain S-box-containing protein